MGRAWRVVRVMGALSLAVSACASHPLATADAATTDDGSSGSGGGGSGGRGGTSEGAGGTGGRGGASGSGGGSAGGMAGCEGAPLASRGSVFTGDLLIADAAGAQAAQAYSDVTGTVRVATTFAGTLALPNLRTIGGDLAVESVITSQGALVGSNITRLQLPNLTQVGGQLWLYLNFMLVELDLRSLASVGDRVWIYRDTVLVTIRLDTLTQVAKELYFGDDTALPSCVADGIAAHVTAFGASTVTGGPSGCTCETVCAHPVARCP